MNIFILDYDPELSAKYHCNKHVVKMPTEYAQLLSSAVRLSGIDEGYRLTHANHPCAIWVRECVENWDYLQVLLYYLNEEYKFRYEHTVNHKAYDVAVNLTRPNLPSKGSITPFALAMPDYCKTNDVVRSYRNYYIEEKAHILDYKKRPTPYWL